MEYVTSCVFIQNNTFETKKSSVSMKTSCIFNFRLFSMNFKANPNKIVLVHHENSNFEYKYWYKISIKKTVKTPPIFGIRIMKKIMRIVVCDKIVS